VTDVTTVSAIELVQSVTGGSAPLASYAYRGDGLRHSATVGASTTTYTWDVGAGAAGRAAGRTYTYVHGLGGA